jgi:CheY-like chemotaxis protein
MDHMMPEMDGIETVIRIRKLESEDGYYQDLPIVAVTANVISGMKEMFIKHGMNDFLSKPIDVSKLNAILNRWLPKEKKEEYRPEDLPEVNDQELEEDEPFTINGIDVDKGLSMTGGTLEYYIESLQSYVKDGQEKVFQINETLQDEDISLYTTYVHALKSASASIGAIKLSESARKLEAAGANQNIDYINTHNDAFISELETTIANISIALDDRETRVSTTLIKGSVDELQKELPVLREALDSMDIQKADLIIKQLTSKKWDQATADAIQEISRNVLFSDFDEAIAGIDVLMENAN